MCTVKNNKNDPNNGLEMRFYEIGKGWICVLNRIYEIWNHQCRIYSLYKMGHGPWAMGHVRLTRTRSCHIKECCSLHHHQMLLASLQTSIKTFNYQNIFLLYLINLIYLFFLNPKFLPHFYSLTQSHSLKSPNSHYMF